MLVLHLIGTQPKQTTISTISTVSCPTVIAEKTSDRRVYNPYKACIIATKLKHTNIDNCYTQTTEYEVFCKTSQNER